MCSRHALTPPHTPAPSFHQVYLARFVSDGSLGALWQAAVDTQVEANLVSWGRSLAGPKQKEEPAARRAHTRAPPKPHDLSPAPPLPQLLLLACAILLTAFACVWALSRRRVFLVDFAVFRGPPSMETSHECVFYFLFAVRFFFHPPRSPR